MVRAAAGARDSYAERKAAGDDGGLTFPRGGTRCASPPGTASRRESARSSLRPLSSSSSGRIVRSAHGLRRVGHRRRTGPERHDDLLAPRDPPSVAVLDERVDVAGDDRVLVVLRDPHDVGASRRGAAVRAELDHRRAAHVLAAVVVGQALDHELPDSREADDLRPVHHPHEIVRPELIPGRPVAVVERHRVAGEQVADPLAVDQLLQRVAGHQ